MSEINCLAKPSLELSPRWGEIVLSKNVFRYSQFKFYGAILGTILLLNMPTIIINKS